jgi:hypothetical protein
VRQGEPAAPVSAGTLEGRPVVGGVFAADVIVGPLNAVEFGDAVGFAFPNPALHRVPFIFAV